MQVDSFESLELLFKPAPYLVYKPNPRDATKGAAAKFELSVRPEFNELGWMTRRIAGGFFLEIAGQTGIDATDNAQFGWSKADDDERLVVKLGPVDLQNILYAFKRIRDDGKPLPVRMRPKGEETGLKLSLFHKFDDSSSIIEVNFSEQGSLFTVSKGKNNRRTISIGIAEEMTLRKYLDHALWAFLMVGER